jgi:hypothetical protein
MGLLNYEDEVWQKQLYEVVFEPLLCPLDMIRAPLTPEPRRKEPATNVREAD